ncbi:MAG: radical SAM protein [Anaerolineae bacterium]|nr:radical SAM protein [Anaerolineae bacterium]
MNAYIHIERIEFAVTYRCNSHCAHCQVDDALRTAHPAALDAALGVQIVKRIAGVHAVHSTMTWGGEPLLYPDTVCAIHATARACGIARRSVLTNAGWPRDEKAFHEVARGLAASGVNDIGISVDAFHQEHIPVEVVERNARALLDAGIEGLFWNPCWVVSADHDNPWNQRTREVLAALSHLPIVRDPGNVVQPWGHAVEHLAAYLPPRVPAPDGMCGNMPYTSPLDQISSVGIAPNGDVEICPDLSIGNAAREDVLAILERYDPYQIPETRALLEGGVRALASLAADRGIALDPEGYYGACDMCVALRRALRTT